MSDFDYDLIVIGAGSGGTRTARISASMEQKLLSLKEIEQVALVF